MEHRSNELILGRKQLHLPNSAAYKLAKDEYWLRHHVSLSDTMMHLALIYDSSVGDLCRINRMHIKDPAQMRRFIWVPARKLDGQARAQVDGALLLTDQLTENVAVTSERFELAEQRLPAAAERVEPTFLWESNDNEFAVESGPLLLNRVNVLLLMPPRRRC